MADGGSQGKRKKGIIRGTGRTLLDLPTWFSLTYLKSAHKNIFSLIVDSFTFTKSKRTGLNDFSFAMQRQGVTDADLEARMEAFQRNIVLMSGFGVVVGCYSLYLLFSGAFLGCLVGLIVTTLSFAKAFQFSLWKFQIKHRKLGCTFEEWRSGKVASSLAKTNKQDTE